MHYLNYCRRQCYVLSKLLQTLSVMYYPNYCRPPVLCIIQITVGPNTMYYLNYGRRQCYVLPELLQAPSVMYYLLHTPGLCFIKITANPNC